MYPHRPPSLHVTSADLHTYHTISTIATCHQRRPIHLPPSLHATNADLDVSPSSAVATCHQCGPTHIPHNIHHRHMPPASTDTSSAVATCHQCGPRCILAIRRRYMSPARTHTYITQCPPSLYVTSADLDVSRTTRHR
ncbi:hypothetical protein BDR04DRAFT_1163842 [Suillus decipiens]|nr:hypothetical protein BDR04DRAFT_1163842 [Suillus decipiens]